MRLSCRKKPWRWPGLTPAAASWQRLHRLCMSLSVFADPGHQSEALRSVTAMVGLDSLVGRPDPSGCFVLEATRSHESLYSHQGR